MHYKNSVNEILVKDFRNRFDLSWQFIEIKEELYLYINSYHGKVTLLSARDDRYEVSKHFHEKLMRDLPF